MNKPMNAEQLKELLKYSYERKRERDDEKRKQDEIERQVKRTARCQTIMANFNQDMLNNVVSEKQSNLSQHYLECGEELKKLGFDFEYSARHRHRPGGNILHVFIPN